MPAVGDLLVVDGVCARAALGEPPNDLTVTTLEARSWTRERSGQPLPAPVTLGPGGRPLPCAIADGADGPGALATLESLEGMLVELRRGDRRRPHHRSGDVVVVVDLPACSRPPQVDAACCPRMRRARRRAAAARRPAREDAARRRGRTDLARAAIVGFSCSGYLRGGRYRLHPLPRRRSTAAGCSPRPRPCRPTAR
jgi:hypothetical protein